MKIMILLFICLITAPAALFAQLERERVVVDEPVELTFMAPRNINLFTVEPLSKGELHYSIMHTFGEVRSGAKNLWGIDQGANVRFSFEYGFSDQLSLGFGRSSMDKVYDIHGRLVLVRQSPGTGFPFSISMAPSIGITTGSYEFLDENYSLVDRLSFSAAMPVARKFNDALSLQLVPMVSHFNRVGAELNLADPAINTYYSVGFAGRYKFSPRSAVTLQAIPPATSAENLDWNLGIGVDIETGGHVFQMFFTTSRALNESYLVGGENGNFFDRQFRFGFNVNRLFRVR